MHSVLKRFYFIIEDTEEPSPKINMVVEFRAENLERAKQEYAEVLGWCGGYKVLQIVERNADEPASHDFLIALTVPSGNS